MAAQDGNKCERFLLKLAGMLPNNWDKLAIHCGFSSDEIDDFSVNAAFEMLRSLRKRKPASLRKTLIKSLEAIGRNDGVELVKKQRYLIKQEMKSSKSKTGTVRQRNSANKPSTQKKKEMKSSKAKTRTVRQPNSAKPSTQTKKEIKSSKSKTRTVHSAKLSTQMKKEKLFCPYETPPEEFKSAVTGEGIDVYYDKINRQDNLKRTKNDSWYFWACLTCVLADSKEKTVLTQFFMENEEEGKQVHQMIQETSSGKRAKLTGLVVLKPEKKGGKDTLKFYEKSAISM